MHSNALPNPDLPGTSKANTEQTAPAKHLVCCIKLSTSNCK